MRNQQQNDQSNKRKKMIVLTATTVALIGGGLYSASLLNAPSKISTQSSSEVSKEKDSTSDLDKVKKAQKKTKKSEKKNAENNSPLQTLDTLNDQISLEKILDQRNPTLKNTQRLVDKISESTSELSDTIQDVLGKKKTTTKEDGNEKIETPTNNIEESEDIPRPLPNPSPTPPPSIPDPTPVPDPEPEPNPNPDPDPDPTPSIDELVAISKEALNTAAEKAEQLNDQLLDIHTKLTQLQTIESKTNEKATLAEEQWSKVQTLVNEYQSISAELKALIEADGTILESNQAIYNMTYEKLNNKLTELKEARSQANNTADTMNQSIEKAENTLNTLDTTQTEYQDKQQQVSDTTTETNTAVTNAQKNSEVANAVQPELNQANQATDTMNTTNQTVGEQLNTIDQQTSQDAIDAAKQTAEGINDVAVEQNDAVDTVIDEFNSLPKPTAEKDSPVVPATVENAEQTSSTTNTQPSVVNTDSETGSDQ